MYLPIKIYTTPESLIVFQLSVPIWFGFRWGMKMKNTIYKDRWFKPQLHIGYADDVKCLHLYILGFRIRIRSFSCIKRLRQQSDNVQQIIFSKLMGWQQVSQ